MKPNCFQLFAKVIEVELGIVYGEHNFYQLQNRLEEIAKIYALSDVEKLHEKAIKEGISGNLKQLILDIATNNETSFFRDNKVFQNIEKTIIPSLTSMMKPGETLNIWSAASSYGQEPYSLAILLNEMREKNWPGQFEIMATDIVDRVLARAEQGLYSQLEIQRGLTTPLLLKYFTKNDQDYWKVNQGLRNYIKFKKQNLKEPFNFEKNFHMILCRNVLIYQGLESKIEIIKKFSKCLLPGGYLILGAGESLLGISSDFEQILLEGSFLYRKPLSNGSV